MSTTLEDILKEVQANVDRSTDPIDWSDEDTLVRIELVNRAIRSWGLDNVTRWDELTDNYVLGTVQEGTTSFSLNDDHQYLEAVVDGSGSTIEVKTIREAIKPGRYVYVSGNKADGFELNLGWTPTSEDALIGKEIRAIGYREPVELGKPTDIPEMRDPGFITAYVSSELMIDDDTAQFSKYAADAATKLANMRDLQAQLANGQTSSAFEDYSTGLGGY